PSHRLTVSPSHRLTVSPSHRLTVSPSHRLTVSPSHRLTPSPPPLPPLRLHRRPAPPPRLPPRRPRAARVAFQPGACAGHRSGVGPARAQDLQRHRWRAGGVGRGGGIGGVG